jgi:predicted nucleic acid-binding protein
VKLVVDTNIVFSAVLNSNSRIARILTSGRRHFEFYSCEFLRVELISTDRNSASSRTFPEPIWKRSSIR